MTDKQIIIDYKNLCENYSKEVGCYGTFDGSCIKEQCFTYKLLQQLQAKEQECERRKEFFETAKEASNCNLRALGEMTEWADKLDEENDQLKEQLKAKEQECEELAYENYELNELFDRLKAENEGFKILHKSDKGLITSIGKQNYQLLQEYDKLKTALTEIKEIAEHCIKQDICTTCDNSDKCHIEDEEIPTYDVCKLILQIINECEVG